ncbi:MAG: SLC13 family permease [Pseudomonadota bacterium]
MDSAALDIAITIGLTIAVFYGFIRERLPADVIAMLAFATLLATGVLDSRQALAVFANPGAITVAAMFVLSAALERTGVIEAMGLWVGRMAGASPTQAMLALMAAVIGLSAFINNTPVVVILTPVTIALARTLKISASRLLIPLSFASIFGGTMTMIGTSTNILVDGVARGHGLPPFAMFEISGLGAAVAAIGTLYMLIVGRWLLPDRETLASLVDLRRGRKFLTEAMVPESSPFIGKTLGESGIAKAWRARIIDVIRANQSLRLELEAVRLEAGDRLVLRAEAGNVLGLHAGGKVAFDPALDAAVAPIASQETVIMEGIVGPQSRFVGMLASDLSLRRLYGVYVLAIHRRSENLRRNFAEVRLDFGDTLLLEGPPKGLAALFDRGDLINLTQPFEKPYRRAKAPIAILAILGVMGLAAFDVLPIAALALIAASAVIALRCVEAEEAYRAIEWRILILIFGMLALGQAMESTGAARLFAEMVASYLAPFGPLLVLSLVYFITSMLTEVMSNNAAAILITPIAISLAEQMGVDARPFVVAVMFAASASFATPIGYQTNTFVYNAGGYKFMDFVRVGLPLNIVLWLASTFLIPLFWPL